MRKAFGDLPKWQGGPFQHLFLAHVVSDESWIMHHFGEYTCHPVKMILWSSLITFHTEKHDIAGSSILGVQ